MNDIIDTAGMILAAYDYAEYDKRLKVLTADVGKVTVFARGVRRQNSRFMGMTDMFSFGDFRLFAGKSAYNLSGVEISNYFEEIRHDMEKMCFASYFADLADYSVHENMEGRDMLLLLYRSLQALDTDSIDNRLVRAVYELRTVMANGVYPGLPPGHIMPGTANALGHIEAAQIRDLFSFKVKDEVMEELCGIADEYRKRYLQGSFKSLDVMSELGYTDIGAGIG
ncbi:MAG: DNA repair protein RecO [Lachnospiraceae bacterium]|nr:DNA repair protein RecO [Lachnospiraceae bacterium]